MRLFVVVVVASILIACEKDTSGSGSSEQSQKAAVATETAAPMPATEKLKLILDSQPAEYQARYKYRHPAETIEFFGIEPGMTVVEYLPGGGWYSQILAPYLGDKGILIGADYDMELWNHFEWMNDKFLAGRIAWPAEWEAKFTQWGGHEAAKPVPTTIPKISEEYKGQVDVALFIRALHNLYRFEENGRFLTEALNKSYELLKPGGILGIVQHQASEEKSDEWARGDKGYLKKSTIKQSIIDAGFEFVAESNINENPLDQPGENDIVWRLPPSNYIPDEDEAKKEAYAAIGESNRMTLLFKKPTQ